MVLDINVLRRGNMVQVFRPDGSDLYVQTPRKLSRLPRVVSEKPEGVDVLKARPARGWRRKAMTIMVDTGDICCMRVSQRRRKLLTKSGKRRTLPNSVVVNIGDGCRLHAHPLEETDSTLCDFIAGIGVLQAYGAILDYARHSLYVSVESQWRKMTTQSWP